MLGVTPPVAAPLGPNDGRTPAMLISSRRTLPDPPPPAAPRALHLAEPPLVPTRREGPRIEDLVDAAVRSRGLRSALPPLPTGTDGLDAVLGGGLHPGDLIVLAGAPGSGRTDIALRWARAAVRTSTAVLVVSFDRDEVTILRRLLAQELRDLPVHARSLEVAQAALDALRSCVSVVAPARAGDVLSFDAAVRRHLPEGGGLLVVDELSKVGADTALDGSAIHPAQRLKSLALTRALPVIALSRVRATAFGEGRPRPVDLVDAEVVGYECDVLGVVAEATGASADVATRRRRVRSRQALHVVRNRRGPAGVEVPLPHLAPADVEL
jgi:hypothetical protein